MKLRIFGNNIRWRLNRREVERLAQGQSISDRVNLVPQPLRYSIGASAQSATTDASFRGGNLVVTLPLSEVRDWARSGDLGLSQTLSTESGDITLLVEKDLKCLHGETADQEECFPNPLAQASR